MRAGPYWESANWACLFFRPGGTASFAVSGVFAVLVRGQVAHKRVETGQKIESVNVLKLVVDRGKLLAWCNFTGQTVPDMREV